jgi:K+-sensing histidine kinase KdpD
MDVGLREHERQRRLSLLYGYTVAVVGAGGGALLSLIPRGAVDLAIIVLLLVTVVLAAALVGGRGPAWVAALLSSAVFDLFHVAPYGRLTIDNPQEIEVMIAFALIAFLVGEMAVAGLGAREKILRTEFREARIGRILAASAAGADRELVVQMIGHELADELDLDDVRYEPNARTTCHYRIDQDGQLYHHADPVTIRRQLPAEPVSVPVRAGSHDFGQLVLIAGSEHAVDEHQLLMAAHMASLLAGLLHAVPPAS